MKRYTYIAYQRAAWVCRSTILGMVLLLGLADCNTELGVVRPDFHDTCGADVSRKFYLASFSDLMHIGDGDEHQFWGGHEVG